MHTHSTHTHIHTHRRSGTRSHITCTHTAHTHTHTRSPCAHSVRKNIHVRTSVHTLHTHTHAHIHTYTATANHTHTHAVAAHIPHARTHAQTHAHTTHTHTARGRSHTRTHTRTHPVRVPTLQELEHEHVFSVHFRLPDHVHLQREPIGTQFQATCSQDCVAKADGRSAPDSYALFEGQRTFQTDATHFETCTGFQISVSSSPCERKTRVTVLCDLGACPSRGRISPPLVCAHLQVVH